MKVRKFFEQYSSIIKAIGDAYSAESAIDAVKTGGSVSGILVNLFLTPLLDKINKPNEQYFWKTLINDVAVPAFDSAIESAQEFDRRDFVFKLDDLPPVYEEKVTHVFTYAPIVWLKDHILGILRNAGDDIKTRFCAEYRAKALAEFGKAEWQGWFAAINENLNDAKRTEYLGHLIEFENMRSTPDQPALKHIYVAEKVTLMESGQWGIFEKSSGEIENAEDFIKSEYFCLKNICKGLWNKEGNELPILYISAHFGAGKTTFLKWFAASLARQYLVGDIDYYPLLMELKNGWTLSDIEARLKNKHDLTLNNKNEPIFFLLDSMDESGPPDDAHIGRLMDEFTEIRKNYVNSVIIATTRPVGGPEGKIADTLRRKKLPFMFLAGFNKYDAKNFIERAKKAFGPIIPTALDYGAVASRFLSEQDIGKPLFLSMLMRLFADGALTLNASANEVRMTRAELYLLFLDRLTGRMRLRQVENDDSKLKYRHILRRLAAIRQLLELSSKGRPVEGIAKGEIEKRLGCEDWKLFNDNKLNEYLILSHFGEKNSHLEFLHKSFREFLVAEYLLEIFILGKEKFRLHLGYITKEAVDFFYDLARLLAKSLQGDNAAVEYLSPVLKSICEGDKHFHYRLDKEKKSFSDTAGAAREIVENTIKWLHDKSIFARISGEPVEIFGMKAARLEDVFYDDHSYSENWYCYSLLHAFGDEGHLKISDYCIGGLLEFSLNNPNFDCRLFKLSSSNLSIADILDPGHRFAYIRGISLRSANLAGMDFSKALVPNSDLYRANLRGANFSEAFFPRADFTLADLREANFIGADLREAKFTRADLREAKLSEALLIDANLSGARLVAADLSRADLTRTDLREAVLEKGIFSRSDFYMADLSGANLNYTLLGSAKNLTEEQIKSSKSYIGAKLPNHLWHLKRQSDSDS